MRKHLRTLIAAASLLLFFGGVVIGGGMVAMALWGKIAGGVFTDQMDASVVIFAFGILGGVGWLLASIDRRLEQREN
jgi:hypothetical protein